MLQKSVGQRRGRALYSFNFLYVNVGKLIAARKKVKMGLGGGGERGRDADVLCLYRHD